MTFTSRAPWWVILLILVSLLVALIVALALQKRVKAPGIPVCATCIEERRQMFGWMWASIAGIVVLPVLAGQLSTDSAPGLVLLLAGLVGCPIATLLLFSVAQWPARMRAKVDQTEQFVEVRKVAPAFALAFQQMVAPRPVPFPSHGYPAPPFPSQQAGPGTTILPGG